MSGFTVAELQAAVAGIVLQPGAAALFGAVCTDSRNCPPQGVFVALAGERYDGHAFIDGAIANGCRAVVVSRPVVAPEEVAVIQVADTRRALQDMARFHRSRRTIPVIAVTGSNGKTTTKDMIAAVLSARHRVLKTEGNFNNEIGLPLTLLRLTAEDTVAVVEMGMRGRGQIAELAAIACPTMGVVTNVATTHIELLGSVDEIALAKGELVQAIPPTGAVVLNADDPRVAAMAAMTDAKVVTYGFAADATVRGLATRLQAQGIEVQVQYGDDCFAVFVPALGRHNAWNALAAVAVGLEQGLSPAEIRQGLLTFRAGRMRLEVMEAAGITWVNDAYNASPLSMRAALETVGELPAARRVAVLGDMLELGLEAAAAHAEIGRLAAQLGFHQLLTIGKETERTAEAAAAAGLSTMVCADHAAAVSYLRRYLQPGDVVLLKGSRGMQMEKVWQLFCSEEEKING